MDAVTLPHRPSSQSSQYRKLKTQCWEQILCLLSNKSFYFKAEYWPAFVELVSWHHILIDVLPVLITSPHIHEFNEQQLNSLDKQNLNLRKKALVLSQTQNQISNYFTETGIRHLFFKGIALSQWLYGSTTARQCRDIDVIVHPADHAIACSRLEDIGCIRVIPIPDLTENNYRRYRAAMKDVSYLHQDSGSIIELHWALRPFPEAFEFDFDTAYEDRRVMEIGGSGSHPDSNIPVFSNLLHARYIAAHGCLSHWGRLRWLLDWQQIALNTGINWQALIETFPSAKESNYVKRAFLLANKQLQLPVPEPINTLKAPFANQYCMRKQRSSQIKAQYPCWLSRQILNLINQENFKGIRGYGRHMFRKLLAAKTLKLDVSKTKQAIV